MAFLPVQALYGNFLLRAVGSYDDYNPLFAFRYDFFDTDLGVGLLTEGFDYAAGFADDSSDFGDVAEEAEGGVVWWD